VRIAPPLIGLIAQDEAGHGKADLPVPVEISTGAGRALVFWNRSNKMDRQPLVFLLSLSTASP
jgi:hypothetical protein